MENKRFTEPWHTTYHFTQSDIDIQCPKCGGHAVSKGKSEYLLPWSPTDTRLICVNCSYTRTDCDFKWVGPVKAFGRRPCGNCGYKWIEAKIFKATPPKRLFNNTEISCPKCNKKNIVEIKWKIDFLNGKPVDPYNGEKLWYVDSFKDNQIWAYNLDHLFYLKSFFSSSLRERGEGAGKYSTITNLPTWMKSKKNKDDIIKVLDRLIKK